MSEALPMLLWVGCGGVVICNLIAAGAAAIFYIWSGSSTPGVRILSAAAMGGFVPAALTGGVVMIASGTTGNFDAWIVMAPLFLFGLVSSLPGAITVTRKLHRPPDYRSHFE